jgi:photosystem II stability/assembly factor-like uncharacterized protein
MQPRITLAIILLALFATASATPGTAAQSTFQSRDTISAIDAKSADRLNELPEPATAFPIESLKMIDDLYGWAWSDANRLLRTTDGGANWSDITPTNPNIDTFGSFFLDAQNAWLALSSGGILRSSDGGQTWIALNPTISPLQRYLAYYFTTPNDGWAQTSEGAAGSIYIQIYETHDGGATFSPANIIDPGVLENTLQLSNVCGDSYYFDFSKLIKFRGTVGCGDGGAPSVDFSRDRGQTWKTFNLPAPQGLANTRSRPHSPTFITDVDGFLPVEFYSNGSFTNSILVVYATHDGGDTWSLATGQVESFSTLQFISLNDAFVVCQNALCVTRDSGQSWQTVPSDLDFTRSDTRYIMSLQFVNTNVGWVIISENGVYTLYKTTDGGLHWQAPGSEPAPTAQSFEGQIAYVGVDGNVYLIRGDTGKTQQITTDATTQQHYNNPQFSPDSERLAFVKLPAEISYGDYGPIQNGPLLIADTYDLTIRKIADNAESGFEWYPDGSKIGYIQDWMLHTFSLIDSEDIAILENVYSFSLSPRGNKILYSSKPSRIPGETEYCGPNGFNILDINSQNIISIDSGNYTKGWSSDGKWVAIGSGCLGFIPVYPVNIETGKPLGFDELPSPFSGQVFTNLSWAPDGQKFVANLVKFDSGKDAVLIKKTDGSLVGEIPLGVDSVNWSPSGDFIAAENSFYSNDGGIYLIYPNTLTYQKILDKPYSVKNWSPSGGQLLLTGVEPEKYDQFLPIELLIYDTSKNSIILNNVYAGAKYGETHVAWGKLPQAQTGYTLSGNVHLSDQSPLPGVAILLDGAQVTVTDGNGNFRIEGVSAGEHVVEPRLEEYSFTPKTEQRDVQGDIGDLRFVGESVVSEAIITLEAIEVTQGLQDLNNSVPLIAGRYTIVRAYLTSTQPIEGFSADLIVTNQQGNQLKLNPQNESIQIAPLDPTLGIDALRSSLGKTLYYRLPSEWALENLSFHLEPYKYPISKCANNDCTISVPFTNVIPLRFIVYRAIWTDLSGVTHTPSYKEISQALNEIYQRYPLPDDKNGIIVDEIRDMNFYPPVPFLDPNVVWSNLSFIKFWDTSPNIFLAVLVDHPQGAICDLPFACSFGYGWGGVATGYWFREDFTFSDGSYLKPKQLNGVLAHELGHTLGRLHSPSTKCGAPSLTWDPNYPDYPNGSISKVSQGIDAIYAIRMDDLSILSPTEAYDLMTYCPNQWPSDFTYRKLIETINARFQSQTTWQDVLVSRKLQSEDVGTFIVSGKLLKDQNSGEINMVYNIPTSVPPSKIEGREFILRTEDNMGNILKEVFINSIQSPDEAGVSYYFSSIAADANATRIVLLNGKGQELTSRQASLNKPIVELKTPNGGENWSGDKAHIEWVGSDADNDQLNYVVQISIDGGITWQTQAIGLTDTKFDLPLEFIAGTNQGLVRVLVSDGFYTAQDTSDSIFAIASHAPQVSISSPQTGMGFAATNSILLLGNGYDAEDGQLSDFALQWNSDKDGLLGSGSSLTVEASNLKLGTHTFTLTATDQDGNQSSASIQIVIEKPDALEPDNNTDVSALLQKLQPWLIPCLGGLGALSIIVVGASVMLLARRNKKQKITAPKQQQPSAPNPKGKLNTSLQLKSAQELSRAGKYKESYDILRQLVQLDPNNADAWLFLGFNLANLGDFVSAEKCLLRAKKLGHPKSEDALAWLKSIKK